MNFPYKAVLNFIFASLVFSLNVYGKEKIDLELQVKPAWMHVEVDITKESLNGYVVKPLSYGASLALIATNLQFGISYDRFSWNRDFTGQMVGVPSPPSPVEEIHESVTSNTFSVDIFYKCKNITKILIPYLGCGIKINFLASEKIGQTTHLHFTSDQFWYPGLSLLVGMQIPITHHINISCEIDICAMGSSSFISVEDGYMPAYNLLKVNSLSLRIGYRFQIPY